MPQLVRVLPQQAWIPGRDDPIRLGVDVGDPGNDGGTPDRALLHHLELSEAAREGDLRVVVDPLVMPAGAVAAIGWAGGIERLALLRS